MGFLRCVIYAAVTGAAAFVLGRILPKKWFDHRKFPYRSAPFEKDGRIYEKIGIKKWQNLLPDMSRIFPSLMPEKKLTRTDSAYLETMIRETCVAEFIHVLLSFTGFYMVKLWQGAGGWIFALVYIVFGNLTFVMIQRYNRPRLIRLFKKAAAKEKTRSL